MALDHYADAPIIIPEVVTALKDAIDVVLFENASFIGREQLQAARQLLDESPIVTSDDSVHVVEQRIMRPLRLTDELKQHIMQTTILPDAGRCG